MSAATGTFVKPNQHRLYEELKQFPRTPGIGTLPDNRAGAGSLFALMRSPSGLADHHPRKYRSQRRRCRRGPGDHELQPPVWRRHEPEQPLGQHHEHQ